MIGKLTILSTFGEPVYSPPESLLGTEPSEGYLVNTDNIVKAKVYGTDDSILDYQLNLHDDQSIEFKMIVSETNAAITVLSDATPASNMILLPVYEGALTFIDIDAISSTTSKYYNITDIVWGNENQAGTITRLLLCEGGFTVYPIFVNYNIDQIVDIGDTATTTSSSSSSTSTSSTSSTSTSSTSTSSTSTSSTSTSSTSTSSTSTSSTSTSTTSTIA